MLRSVGAKRVLGCLYRSGWLAQLERAELRLLLFILSGMSDPGSPRRCRPTAIRQALGLSTVALNRAAAELERRGWLRITRTPRTWMIQLTATRGRRGSDLWRRRAGTGESRCRRAHEPVES